MSATTTAVPGTKPSQAATRAKQAKRAPKNANKDGRAKSKNAAAASEPREGSKKAEVIAFLRRPKGVSLSEIQKLTGWQKHSVRGFISLLGSKAKLKIISTRNAAGERSYRVAK